jgi:hypothetical protein
MDTVVELPTHLRSPISKSMNKSAMVAWINGDLASNAGLDVDKAFVFYDEDGDFVFATHNEVNANGLQKLFDHTRVRYWSKGIA